ncbi:Hypothetical protein ORPV_784 [Orpheovirus IHUMI-LCC2]|uniref:Uncharacterized protein n=1 Tax=Orpheovirus IHUMI-LCC2 TaxID=2023057 RepID=A0A2I2L567_9VIRU|nr:Hypothetical protein ORPV_784 [Orpheovirus IHUMI-LCC2]SNW62688.1 Hypothetical protein ORPV_784 [Orpheovirus IHUMI-LCC2]
MNPNSVNKLSTISYNALKPLPTEGLINLYNRIADEDITKENQSYNHRNLEMSLELSNEIFRRLTTNWVIGSSFNPNILSPQPTTLASIDRNHIDWGKNTVPSSSLPRYNFIVQELKSSNNNLDLNTILLIGRILLDAVLSNRGVGVGYERIIEEQISEEGEVNNVEYYSPVVLYNPYNNNWIVLQNIRDQNNVKTFDIRIMPQNINEITNETEEEIISNWTIIGIYNNERNNLLFGVASIGSDDVDIPKYLKSVINIPNIRSAYDEINYEMCPLDVQTKSLVGRILLESYINNLKATVGYETRTINLLENNTILTYYVPVVIYNFFGKNWIELQNIQNNNNIITRDVDVVIDDNSYIPELYQILSNLNM